MINLIGIIGRFIYSSAVLPIIREVVVNGVIVWITNRKEKKNEKGVREDDK